MVRARSGLEGLGLPGPRYEVRVGGCNRKMDGWWPCAMMLHGRGEGRCEGDRQAGRQAASMSSRSTLHIYPEARNYLS